MEDIEKPILTEEEKERVCRDIKESKIIMNYLRKEFNNLKKNTLHEDVQKPILSEIYSVFEKHHLKLGDAYNLSILVFANFKSQIIDRLEELLKEDNSDTTRH